MPYPAGHREETRNSIVRSARRLFNRDGYHSVSIDQIMAEAGLTRGGFYSYFSTKAELYAEAITFILTEHPAEDWEGVNLTQEGPEVARAIVKAYLGDQHFGDVEGTCPLVAQPNDVARGGKELKGAFSKVLGAMISVFDDNAMSNRRSNREAALAVASLCVGGMVLARSVSDSGLADEIRQAAMKVGLETGGWDQLYDA